MLTEALSQPMLPHIFLGCTQGSWDSVSGVKNQVTGVIPTQNA